MDAEHLLAYFQSEQYHRQMAALYFASMGGAILIVIAAIVFYLRTKSSRSVALGGVELLLATAFDTFLVSALYVAIELLYRADVFRNDAADIQTPLIVIGGVLTLYGNFFITLLLAMIILVRAQILARWFWQESKS